VNLISAAVFSLYESLFSFVDLQCLADVVSQSKLDSSSVDETVSAEAWQPSIDDDDKDESPSDPLTVILPTTEPGSTSFSFVSNLTCSLYVHV